MVVDGEMATVGTSNFDMRSFRLNFEVNNFVYNEKFAKKSKEFLHDLKNCTIANENTSKNKTQNWKRFKQKFARLFAPIL